MVFWGPEGKKELFRSLLSFQAIAVALLNSTGNKIIKRVKKMATVRAALFATTMWYVREDFLRYVHVLQGANFGFGSSWDVCGGV